MAQPPASNPNDDPTVIQGRAGAGAAEDPDATTLDRSRRRAQLPRHDEDATVIKPRVTQVLPGPGAAPAVAATPPARRCQCQGQQHRLCEPGRSSTVCAFSFTEVPAGKRLVLTHISGYVDTGAGTLPNGFVSSGFGGSTCAALAFTGALGTRIFINHSGAGLLRPGRADQCELPRQRHRRPGHDPGYGHHWRNCIAPADGTALDWTAKQLPNPLKE